MNNIPLYCASPACLRKAQALAEHLNVPLPAQEPSGLHLLMDENGLSLSDGNLSMQADFTESLRRLKPNNLGGELLVKAAKIKNNPHPVAVDATAGLGEDSILLAASGFDITLCEYNPVICALLKDALERACNIPELSEIARRMSVYEGSSIDYLTGLDPGPDVVVLDPMFPERQKSGLIKKKFQLLQQLESPCSDEKELLDAAMKANPHKTVIKRPLKGPYLAGIKPDYSLNGKAIRYDIIVKA